MIYHRWWYTADVPNFSWSTRSESCHASRCAWTARLFSRSKRKTILFIRARDARRVLDESVDADKNYCIRKLLLFSKITWNSIRYERDEIDGERQTVEKTRGVVTRYRVLSAPDRIRTDKFAVFYAKSPVFLMRIERILIKRLLVYGWTSKFP